jgi:ATP-binding cassette subfamily F protein uup
MEKKELEQLPSKIQALENEQKLIEQNLENLYNIDTDKAHQNSLRYAKIEEELVHLLDRWEQLELKSK